MSRKLVLAKRLLLPLITGTLLMVIFYFYYTVYVSAERKYLDERAFRILSAFSEKLEQQRTALQNAMNGSLARYEGGGGSILPFAPAYQGSTPSTTDKQRAQQEREEQLESYLAESLGSSYQPNSGKVFKVFESPSTKPSSGVTNSLNLTYLETPQGVGVLASYPVPVGTGELKFPPCVTPSPGPWCLQLQLDLKGTLDNLAAKFGQDYFDQIFIIGTSGRVLYQSGTAGLEFTSVKTLLESRKNQNNPAGQAASFSLTQSPDTGNTVTASIPKSDSDQLIRTELFDVGLAGSEYRAYVRPLRIVIQEPEGKQKKLPSLFVGGLRRKSRIESEAASFPYSTLMWSTLLVLGIFSLGWPFVKLEYMSPKERLRRHQVILLLFAPLVTAMLLTVMVLSYAYANSDRRSADDNLKQLAQRIDANLAAELNRSLDTLSNFPLKPYAGWWLDHRSLKIGADNALLNAKSIFQLRTANSSRYPYFGVLFWADEAGMQRIKIFPGKQSTPFISVAPQSFFTDVRDKRLTPLAGGAHKIALDLLLSPNTGVLDLVVAEPVSSEEFLSHGRGPGLLAQAAVIRPLSLIDPVVPEGYGFAVVDRDGKVQFHSNSARNLVENFIQEAQGDPALQAAITERAEASLNLVYLGRPQRAFTQPVSSLPAFPWTIVVFRDSNLFGIVNITAALLAFALISGIYGLIILFTSIWIFRLKYPLQALWPSTSRMPAYLRAALASVFLTATFFFTYASFTLDQTLAAVLMIGFAACAFLIMQRDWSALHERVIYAAVLALMGSSIQHWLAWAATALLVILVIFSLGENKNDSPRGAAQSPRSPGWKRYALFPAADLLIFWVLAVLAGRSWYLVIPALYLVLSYPRISDPCVARCQEMAGNRPRYWYLGMAICLLSVLAVVPCFGFFRVAREAMSVLALKHQQVALSSKMQQRSLAIENSYRVLCRGNAPACPQELQPYVNMRKEETLDRYDQVFLNTSASPSIKNSSPVDVSRLQPLIADFASWIPANSFGAELRALALPASPGQAPRWQASQEGDSRLLVLAVSPGNDPAPPAIASPYPAEAPLQWRTIGFLILLAVVLVFWMDRLVRTIFLLDVKNLPPLDPWCLDPPAGENLIIIAPPKSGKGIAARTLPDTDRLDFRKMCIENKWQGYPREHPLVVISHFEYDLDNPQSCLAKLKVLEENLYVQRRKVMLLSAVDPMPYLADSCPEILTTDPKDPGAALLLLDRWAAVLSQFHKKTIIGAESVTFHTALARVERERAPQGLLSVILRECDHTAHLRRFGEELLAVWPTLISADDEEIIETLLERADSYYRVVWDTCTKEERLVLFQLAKDGWANSKNAPAIQQLLRRKLVSSDSGYQLMNESFRRFIRRAQDPEEIAAWERDERASTWHGVKVVLGTASIFVGGWLFYSQQDILKASVGYLAAVGAAGTAILGIIRSFVDFRGKGSSTGGNQANP